MGLRVLITGINGFVGSHLCHYLNKLGHQVFGTDITPIPALREHPNRARQAKNEGAEGIETLPAELFYSDITDFSSIKAVLEKTRPEWIFHLAGITSVAEAEKNPVPTYQINTLGTLKLLLAVHQLRLPARILIVSSADVYGRAEKPRSESDPPCPLTAYARSKLLAEEIGRLYYQTWGMDIVIVRAFSHTGPGQEPKFVFPKVAFHIAQVEKGNAEAVLKMGNLAIRRDYTDVRDIVRAYVLTMENCLSGETYNVTSGNAIRLQDGVETLLKLARKTVQVQPCEAEQRPYDIPYLSGDCEKFKAVTGWQPEIPLEKTLADLLDYWRKRV